MQDVYIQEKIEGPKRYQSFFTNAEEINDLMISLLGDIAGAKVLEPCAGRGAFIMPLLNKVARIDAIDIDSAHVRELNSIREKNLYVQEGDFIDYFVCGRLTSPLSIDADYDALICNPPYGLKFAIPYRKMIKAKYPDLYARESYGLFMVFGLRCLKNHGRFVFVVPDTFLTSRNHRPLRVFLRDNMNVTHLVQFNSERFESVNFGYGNLCIISGNRSLNGQHGDVLWLDYRRSKAPLTLHAFDSGKRLSSSNLRQSTDHAWVLPKDEADLFASSLLGEIAECRTGIYTGDNIKFCAYDELCPPFRINGHSIAWSQVRSTSALTHEERENGLENPPYYVPFVRGGHRVPFEETRSALAWSQESVNYYRTDRNARLQNSRFYFRKGLAVPMVTSGRLSASYMEGAVFDQGVVGVFPKKERWIGFLLVFLNSEQATEMKRNISPGANNSANYLKRLRVPVPDENQLKESEQICTRWRIGRITDKKTIKIESTAFVTRHFLPAEVAA